MTSRPAIQLALLLGEGALLLLSGGAMFVVISRWAGPELLGEYALVFAWLMLAQGLASFGIPEFIMREIGRLADAGSKHAFHGMIIGAAFSVAATLMMAACVPLFDYSPALRNALWIASIALLPAMLSGICRAGFLAQRQMQWIFLIAACETLVVVSVNTYLVLTGHGVVELAATILAGKVLASVLSLWSFHRHAVALRWDFDLGFCKQLLPTIFTFGLGNALGMVSLRINAILLSVWGTMAAVGQYAVATKLTEIALIVPSLFNQLLLPRLARRYATEGHREFGDLEGSIRSFFALAIPTGIGVILFARPIVTLIFGDEFVDAVLVLQVLMVCFLVECLDGLLGVVLKAAGLQSLDVRVYSVNPIVTVSLSLIAIPFLGGVGAALSKLAATLCSSSLRIYAVAREVAPLGWFGIVAKPLAIAGAAAACSAVLVGVVPVAASALVYACTCSVLLWLTRVFSFDALKAALQGPGG